MSLYMGSGFRCRRSVACGFRIIPASGDDQDLNEAAQAIVHHERMCRFEAIVPDKPLDRLTSLDDRRTASAVKRAELDAGIEAPIVVPPAVGADLQRRGLLGRRIAPAPATSPDHPAGRPFHVTCRVCGEKFWAAGGRASYCAKASCQRERKVPTRTAA